MIKVWVAGLVLFGLALGLARGEDTRSAPERPRNPDVVTESLETVYRLENDGTGTVIQTVRRRVESPVGRQALGQIMIPYQSDIFGVRFDYLRTLKKDGRRAEARPEDARDVERGSAGGSAPVLSDAKVKVLTTPDLDIGDRVEWRVTMTIGTPQATGEFWAMHQAEPGFVESEKVVLDIPAGRTVALRIGPGEHSLENAEGRAIHRWTLSHPGPPDKEPKHPPATFAVSTFETWGRLAEWFRGPLVEAAKPTPEVEALARQLTAGRTTARERADAIYGYVARSVRYTALLFGGHGYRPHGAGETLKNGFGDCKDKYALLSALLTAAGVPTEAVLMEMGRDLREPEVPLPVEFNHIIAAIEIDGEAVYLDPTAPVAAFGVLLPNLRGKTGLLIAKDGARIVRLPSTSPLQQFVHASASGSITAAGSIELASRFELRGDLELFYRQMFHETSQDIVRVLTEGMAGQQVDGAEIANITPSDPADLAKPFVVEYRLAKDAFINPLEKEAEATLPRILHNWTLLALSPSAEDDDDDGTGGADPPGGFARPTELTETLTLELPPAYRVALPLPVHVANDLASYASEYRLDGGKLVAQRALQLKSATLPLSRRRELESLRKIVERDQDQKLQLTRTGNTPAADILDSLSADQLNAMGAAALDAGKKDAALPPLVKATEKDPRHAYAWNNLGRAYLAFSRYADAERALNKQLEINAFDEYANNNLGECFRKQKRYDEAIAAYRKQLGINPFDEWAYLGMGLTYREQNRFPEAVSALEEGLRARKDDPALHAALVNVLSLMGRTKEALQHAEKLATQNGKPLTTEMRRMITESSAQSDAPIAPPMRQRVAASGKELEKLSSDTQAETRQLIAKLAQATTPDRSFERLPDLVRLATSLDRLGQALALKGQRAEARTALRLALDMSLDRSVALRLAELEDADGKRDAALRYYAWASTGGLHPVTAPSHLASYLESSYPDRASRESHLSTLMFGFLKDRSVKELPWPQGLVLDKGRDVVVRLLIDEKGAVVGAEPIRGENPVREAAVRDARKLRFSPLVYEGVGIRHSRTIWARYNHNGTIEATWGFGPDPIGECTSGLRGASAK